MSAPDFQTLREAVYARWVWPERLLDEHAEDFYARVHVDSACRTHLDHHVEMIVTCALSPSYSPWSPRW